VVEKLVREQMVENGPVIKVKWKGHASDHNIWEPTVELQNTYRK